MDTATDGIYGKLPLLSEYSIRLLRLRPAKPGGAYDLEAELYVVQLDSVRDAFTALSYTWGLPRSMYPICINWSTSHITQNLYEFLLELRNMGIYDPLWIDAICIDQRSDAEKNHQVPLMGSIYSSAIRIRSWLGQNPDLAVVMRTYGGPGFLDWNLEPLLSQRPNTDVILASILDHPYWTRTWIVQEVLLAKSIDVHCCSTVLPWEIFINMTYYLGLRTSIGSLNETTHSNLSRLYHQRMSQAPRSLPALLRRFRKTQCADRHDRVFALVGLINVEEDPLYRSMKSSEEASSRAKLLDYTLPLPVLVRNYMQHYHAAVADTFVLDLWEAFDIDQNKFSISQDHKITMHVSAYVTCAWKPPQEFLIKPSACRLYQSVIHHLSRLLKSSHVVHHLYDFQVHHPFKAIRVNFGDGDQVQKKAYHVYVEDKKRLAGPCREQLYLPHSRLLLPGPEHSCVVYVPCNETNRDGYYLEMSWREFLSFRLLFESHAGQVVYHKRYNVPYRGVLHYSLPQIKSSCDCSDCQIQPHTGEAKWLGPVPSIERLGEIYRGHHFSERLNYCAHTSRDFRKEVLPPTEDSTNNTDSARRRDRLRVSQYLSSWRVSETIRIM